MNILEAIRKVYHGQKFENTESQKENPIVKFRGTLLDLQYDFIEKNHDLLPLFLRHSNNVIRRRAMSRIPKEDIPKYLTYSSRSDSYPEDVLIVGMWRLPQNLVINYIHSEYECIRCVVASRIESKYLKYMLLEEHIRWHSSTNYTPGELRETPNISKLEETLKNSLWVNRNQVTGGIQNDTTKAILTRLQQEEYFKINPNEHLRMIFGSKNEGFYHQEIQEYLDSQGVGTPPRKPRKSHVPILKQLFGKNYPQYLHQYLRPSKTDTGVMGQKILEIVSEPTTKLSPRPIYGTTHIPTKKEIKLLKKVFGNKYDVDIHNYLTPKETGEYYEYNE